MSFQLTTAIEPGFLRINATGSYTFDSLIELIERTRSEADRQGRKHVLIDCLSVSGSMTDVEKFLAGKKIAEVFGSRLKVASLISAEKINKLGEMAAVNRGARFLVTASEPEAIKW